MKKIVIAFILVLFCNNSTVYSQKSNVNSQPLKERIFLDYNSSFFLNGEHLYYKVFCIKARNNRLSNLSKVAYVELINSDKNIVFKHKIRLNNGVGNGSFFIPKSVLSGNYKLIAYTQWMRNEGSNYFFQGDITIVNTLLNNQNITIKETNVPTTITTAKSDKVIPSKNEFLELTLKRKEYKKRDKVVLKINSLDNQKAFGNYSISIRKIDSIEKPKKYSPKNYISLYPENTHVNKASNNKVNFLPEFKGGLLSGEVLFKGTKKPVPNVMVLLSSPTGEYPLRFAITNSLGNFEFIFKYIREEPTAIVQVLDENRENYSITLNNQKPFDYSSLTFNEFRLPLNTEQLLLAYSIQNQIENAYLNEKQDIILDGKKQKSETILSTDEIYILDDYNRFSTVRETIIEIINNVWITKKKGIYTFHVRNNDVYDEDDSYLPLVLVDGVLIQDHNEIVDYNAKSIKKITVVRDKFVYKSLVFMGIITMETFEGNYNKNLSKDYIKQLDLFVPLKSKNIYIQEYNTNKFDRIPDYRRQLLWNPNLGLNKKENKITFYTSDISGDYEICLEGFNQEGQPVSLKEVFSVK